VAVSAIGLAVTGVIELLLAILTGSVGLLGDAIHNLSDSANPPYRLGGLLARARRSWIEQVRERMQQAGFPGYRQSDAWMRAPIGSSWPSHASNAGPCLGR
jgi:hypothetical protein